MTGPPKATKDKPGSPIGFAQSFGSSAVLEEIGGETRRFPALHHGRVGFIGMLRLFLFVSLIHDLSSHICGSYVASYYLPVVAINPETWKPGKTRMAPPERKGQFCVR